MQAPKKHGFESVQDAGFWVRIHDGKPNREIAYRCRNQQTSSTGKAIKCYKYLGIGGLWTC